jgi:hypothetical protein
MTIKRTLAKSGCGCGGSKKSNYVFELSSPLNKTTLPVFQQAGYVASETYSRVGVFFVEKQGISASGPIGGNKVQVRCMATANCNILLDHLENTFKIAGF